MFSQRNNPYCEFLQILSSKDIINFNDYQIIFNFFYIFVSETIQKERP